MATSISFDGNDMQTVNILSQIIGHHGASHKVNNIMPLAHANYSVNTNTSYPGKPIPVSGELVAATIEEMDVLEDTFKAYFNGNEKNLDIGHAGGIRRYIATADEPIIDRPNGLTFATFMVNFNCLYPFGRNISQTTALSATGRTSAVYADALAFVGSFPYQYPIITINFTAISGGTAKTVTVGNNANGQQISVTRDWVATDVLQIDVSARERIVTVNGTKVDYSGAFLEFPPGSQYIGYADNFTSRTFNYNVGYYPQWQ